MKTLGISTSSDYLSFALAEKGKIIASTKRHLPKRHSTQMLKILGGFLKLHRIRFNQIKAVAIDKGPGSFTGLRIGMTLAKTLALVLDKPIIGISSLDALAYNLKSQGKFICPLIDARRGNVYTRIYQVKDSHLKPLSGYLLLPVEKVLSRLSRNTVFVGDGLKILEPVMGDERATIKFAAKRNWFPDARMIALLGEQNLSRARIQDKFKLVPLYLYSKECNITSGVKK